MNNIDYKIVKSFLKIVRTEIEKRNFILVPRKDIDIGSRIVNYKEALLDLGVDIKDVPKYICNLNENECIKIELDYDKKRDMNSEWFIFLTIINGINTYIKISINNEGIVCLSFHRSKYERGDQYEY